MGTLFSSFYIARSGLHTAQVQLDTAGHNIANVNKVGFTRQRVEVVSVLPLERPFGYIGRGIRISGIVRLRDEFLDQLYRRQSPGLGNAETQAKFLSRIEDVFLEPTENGLGMRLNQFFDSLNGYANNVEAPPLRQSVINESQALVSLFQETAGRLDLLRTNANEEIINFVPRINALAAGIAGLNSRIRDSELGGHAANDLRDERDLMLDELSRIVNIFTRERPDGQIDVLVSGASLVNGDLTQELEAVRVAALDPERNDLVEVRFVTSGLPLGIQDGELFGALRMRDITIVDIDSRLDVIAATVIEQINLIQTQASGLVDYSGTVTGTNAVTGAATALIAAGLPFNVSTGTFDLNVYAAGTTTATLTIAAGTTLADLVAAINGVDPANLTAVVTANNTIELTAAPGATFSISNDATGVFAALGLNGLFTGFDARTIGVNQDLVNNPSLLAAGYSTDPLETGDNTAALDLAAVQNGLYLESDTASINDYYETTIVRLGIEVRTNRENLRIEQSFVATFDRRRQEVSGVSLDEEMTMLLQFQRAFEASARVIIITDRMLEALLAIVR